MRKNKRQEGVTQTPKDIDSILLGQRKMGGKLERS